MTKPKLTAEGRAFHVMLKKREHRDSMIRDLARALDEQESREITHGSLFIWRDEDGIQIDEAVLAHAYDEVLEAETTLDSEADHFAAANDSFEAALAEWLRLYDLEHPKPSSEAKAKPKLHAVK